MSRAGSRLKAVLLAAATGDAGGIIAAAGKGAVPVPSRSWGAALGAAGAGLGAAAGAVGAMPATPPGFAGLPRMGAGGGLAAALLGAADAVPGVAAGLLAGTAALGLAAGRGGGLLDSVTDDSARDGQYATACASARLEHYKEISDAG